MPMDTAKLDQIKNNIANMNLTIKTQEDQIQALNVQIHALKRYVSVMEDYQTETVRNSIQAELQDGWPRISLSELRKQCGLEKEN